MADRPRRRRARATPLLLGARWAAIQVAVASLLPLGLLQHVAEAAVATTITATTTTTTTTSTATTTATSTTATTTETATTTATSTITTTTATATTTATSTTATTTATTTQTVTTTTKATTTTTTTMRDPGAQDIPFIMVTCGSDYTLGVSTVHTALNWGRPLSEIEKAFLPQGLLWLKMWAGYSHSCGITEDGEAMCWGRNLEGQCDVPQGFNFEQLSLGEAHTCGVTSDEQLYCWGADTLDRLKVPQDVRQWSYVSCGTFSTCGLTKGGLIYCWGSADYGRLAVPFATETNIFWQGVACGDRHCCGILTDRAVRLKGYAAEKNVVCWGNDWQRQLQVPGVIQGRLGAQEKFVTITAGQTHTCGLTVSMGIWCWGAVEEYGLSTDIPQNTNFTFVNAGGTHTCAIDTNKLAHCWGNNDHEQINVLKDDRTTPPSILEYSKDPADIYAWDDPWNRYTKYDKTDLLEYPALTSFQYIRMSIFLPEFALPGSFTLTFTVEDGGPKDLYSPHVLYFETTDYQRPGTHKVNVSAFDLRYWHDTRWGFNPKVTRVVSKTLKNGTTDHRLVDGGNYYVAATYQDALGHRPASHFLERYVVTYDLVTLPPIIREPVSGRTKQALLLQYELKEDMSPTDVWIVLTFEGLVPGRGSTKPGQVDEDPNSPNEIQLAPAATTKGNHTIEISLVDTQMGLYGDKNPFVERTFQNGQISDSRGLVSGGRYSLTFRCTDLFNNPPAVFTVDELDFLEDIVTEPLVLLQPKDTINNPLFIQYILPERAFITSLQVNITWLYNIPNESRAMPDLNSPHVFWVYPWAEADQVPVTLTIGTADLFKDNYQDWLPNPAVRKFSSYGTPVRSYLQPFSVYRMRISYQDRFKNPAYVLTRTLTTNFSAPDPPWMPEVVRATTFTLEVGWRHGETGGIRIDKYNIQLEELPKNVTIPRPEWESVLYAENRTLTGQTSNDTLFINLRSSTRYRVRVNACQMLGCSAWSAWGVFRTLSVCGDGIVLDDETCDDMNLDDLDGCDSQCRVEEGWICRTTTPEDMSVCVPAGIDGIRVAGEECDDCNNLPGDGCSPDRTVEDFFQCAYRGNEGTRVVCVGAVVRASYTADRCTVICGDGLKHFSEACDDGNLVNNDGCSANCTIEPGYQCTYIWPNVFLSVCDGICGDGLMKGSEECDDKNNAKGDGCVDCKVELGWVCQRKVLNFSNYSREVDICNMTCLNGVIENLEECDDANLIRDDGCNNCHIQRGWTCQNISNRPTDISAGTYCTPQCGDGYRILAGALAEECDDGNLLALDGCSPNCTIEPGWQCKASVVNGSISNDTCTPICGDGLTVGGEPCDDGNVRSRDGCSKDCKVERGYECTAGIPGQRSRCTARCGDGFVSRPNETCDDGNRRPNDGCSEVCATEAGYVCASVAGASASVCTPKCGDGVIITPEECDDGGQSAGDGCSTTCTIEAGWFCVPGLPCTRLCGDGIRLEGEDCDDGNLVQGDGCDTLCRVEPRWICESFVLAVDDSKSVCHGICGDGFIVGAEQCDDGNTAAGDGCDPTCKTETGFTCCRGPRGTASQCTQRDVACPRTSCGDGFRDDGEDCDDGNTVSGDGCSFNCLTEPGFACAAYTWGLLDECLPICGDGLQVTGETCDDANKVPGDGCDNTCQVEFGYMCRKTGTGNLCESVCGDGYRTLAEECDDGNVLPLDGCSPDCRFEGGLRCQGGSLRSRDFCSPICGDGVRMDARGYSPSLPFEVREQCDSGRALSAGCDPFACTLAVGYTCSRKVGNRSDTCGPLCGDGIVSIPYEECDDGNTRSGDGCSPNCTVEALWKCAPNVSSPSNTSVCSIRCGDGRRHPSEICDDGNNLARDGCSPTCESETGYECLGGGPSIRSECRALCGDSLQVYPEECDDGNHQSRDGCNYLCRVETMYYCTLASQNASLGPRSSTCYRTCGTGFVDPPEECDNTVVPDPLGLLNTLPVVGVTAPAYPPSCVHCRFSPGRFCGDGRRSNTSSLREGCDDGNRIPGDGCSPQCKVELGWACSFTPYYVDPPTGDVCAPVCGDGLLLPGKEACDDGNVAPNDGCSADCRIEPYWFCFANVSTGTPLNGSYCVSAVPPRLIQAQFDVSYGRLDLTFDRVVTRTWLPDPSSPIFPCNALLSQETIDRLGTAPECRWKSAASVILLLGSDATLKPGDPVEVLSGVLRRYSFANITAPSHSALVDAAVGGTLAPKAVVIGPEIVSTCVNVIFLQSGFSRGAGGRKPTLTWSLVEAVDERTHRTHPNETLRVSRLINSQSKEDTLVFVRQGFAYSEADLEFDRSLRPGIIYRIRLRMVNLLNLKSSAIHTLKVIDLPVPLVTPLVDQTSMQVRADLYARLAVQTQVAAECKAVNPAIRMGWKHVPIQMGVAPVNIDRYVGRPPQQLALLAGALGTGLHRVVAYACANMTVPQWIASNSSWWNVTRETCGNLTFTIDVVGRPQDSRRLSALTAGPSSGSLAAELSTAAAGASLKLLVFPQDGNYIAGQPEPEEPLRDWLSSIRTPAGNRAYAAVATQGWPGGLEANRTMVLGVLLLPALDATAAQQQALAWARPRVRWQLQGGMPPGLVPQTEPKLEVDTVGAMFLTLPPRQVMFGATVSVTARVTLDLPSTVLPDFCSPGIRQMTLSADLPVNRPPTAGILQVVQQSSAYPLVQFDLAQKQWAGSSYPLQYRFEAQDASTGEVSVLSDWSILPMQSVLFLPRRASTKIIRGFARDGMGAVAATAPALVAMRSGPNNMLLLSEYQEGRADLGVYRSDLLTSLLTEAIDAAGQYGPGAQIQLLQDAVTLALTQPGDEASQAPRNCTTDCGPLGYCPAPVSSFEDVVVSVPVYGPAPCTNASANGTRNGSANATAICGPNGTSNRTGVAIIGYSNETVSKLIAVTNWTQCVCTPPYTGLRCQRHPVEVATQTSLTGLSALLFGDLMPGAAGALALAAAEPDALTRLLGLLFLIVGDCRRVTTDVLEVVAQQTAQLLAASSKAAVQKAEAATVRLVSQLTQCLPDESAAGPAASMPAPSAVLNALGLATICRAAGGGTKTTVCYDLATSIVEVSCPAPAPVAPPVFITPIFTRPAGGLVDQGDTDATSNGTSQPNQTCRADLELGLSDPYPCPCEVPSGQELFLGIGRSPRIEALSDILGSRDDHDLLWRTVASALWNSTVGPNVSTTTLAPAVEAADALKSAGTPATWWATIQRAANNTVTQADLKRQRLNIVKAISNTLALLSDAVALVMVPGQAPTPLATPALSFSAAVATVTLLNVTNAANTTAAPTDNASAANASNASPPSNVSAAGTRPVVAQASFFLDSTARVELDYPGEMPSLDTPVANLSAPPPLFVPVSGVLWRAGGGPFAWLDPTRDLRSGVVSLRLPAASGEFSKVRYRFLVPLLPSQAPPCALSAPPAAAVAQCCGAGAAGPIICAPPPSPPPPTLTFTSTSTTSTTSPPPLPGGYVLDLGGTQVPFVDQPAAVLTKNTTWWVTAGSNSTLAAETLRIRGGDLRFGLICATDRNTRMQVIEGYVLQLPVYGGALCNTILNNTAALPLTAFETVTMRATRAFRAAVTDPNAFPSFVDPPTPPPSAEYWCTGGSFQAPVWCPSGYDARMLPTYGDVLITTEPGGFVLVLGFTAVQATFQGSEDLVYGASNGQAATIFSWPEGVLQWKRTALMYFRTVKYKVRDTYVDEFASLLREWKDVNPTSTTTSTRTITRTVTTTATTTSSSTTTTSPLPPLPAPAYAPGALLRVLETAFDPYVDLLAEALNESAAINGTPNYKLPDRARGLLELRSFAVKTVEAAGLLDIWANATLQATTLDAVAAGLVESTVAAGSSNSNISQPDQGLVQVLQGKGAANGTLSSLNASNASTRPTASDGNASAPGPSGGNGTTNSTGDVVGPPHSQNWTCEEVQCGAAAGCAPAVDPAKELECVAWSVPIGRWTPALGCRLIPASEAAPAVYASADAPEVEVVCECEEGVLHDAVAVAHKLTPLVATQGRLRIVTREVAVVWTSKLNRYNIRGIFFWASLLLAALVHLIIACRQEVVWRARARWVVARADRDREVDREHKRLAHEERERKRRKVAEIQGQKPRPMADDPVAEGEPPPQPPRAPLLALLGPSTQRPHLAGGLTQLLALPPAPAAAEQKPALPPPQQRPQLALTAGDGGGGGGSSRRGTSLRSILGRGRSGAGADGQQQPQQQQPALALADRPPQQRDPELSQLQLAATRPSSRAGEANQLQLAVPASPTGNGASSSSAAVMGVSADGAVEHITVHYVGALVGEGRDKGVEAIMHGGVTPRNSPKDCCHDLKATLTTEERTSCRRCKTVFPRRTSMQVCRSCHASICEACHKLDEGCPSKHDFGATQLTQRRKCRRCLKVQRKGTHVQACGTCGMVLCEECHPEVDQPEHVRDNLPRALVLFHSVGAADQAQPQDTGASAAGAASPRSAGADVEGVTRVFELASLEEAAMETGTEFEHLRNINQSLAEWQPLRPAALLPGALTAEAQAQLALRQAAPPTPPPPAEEPQSGADAADGLRRVEEEPPDPMIADRGPKPVPLSLGERFRLACQRARPANVWKACLIHHKLFSLPMDTQAFIFSAPERVIVFHLSIWCNAVLLALMLHGQTRHRPGEDPHCAQLGVVQSNCMGQQPPFGLMVLSTVCTTVISNAFLVLSRGRCFLALTKHMSEGDREKVFMAHVLGEYPVFWFNPTQATGAVRRWFCCKPRVALNPLPWTPSLAAVAFLCLVPVTTVLLLYTMFFFSSSEIMNEITYSDRPGYMEVLPPLLERDEVNAAAQGGLESRRVLVPLMQRYLVLVSIAWVLHLFILEPLVLAVHLFIGEPSIDYCLDLWRRHVWEPLRTVPGCLWDCIHCRCPRWRRGDAAEARAHVRFREDEDEESDEEEEEEDFVYPAFLPGQTGESAPSTPH